MMLAGTPWIFAAMAAGGAGLVALYVLKLRRRRVEVPFAQLWRRILRDTESTALWRRLRRLISLLIQLLILALILLAIGDPRLSAGTRGRTIVLVIDASASMQAADVKPTRMEAAKEAARKLVRGLGGDDVAMLVRMDARPAPVSGFQSDDRELLREIDEISASDAPADLERALRLSADALRGRKNPELVLVGDGAWDQAILNRIRLSLPGAVQKDLSAIDLSGIDLRYVPVGNSGKNLAITAFAVRRYRANQTAYEVLVEVQSFSHAQEKARLELLQDDEVVEVEPLTLAAGERIQRRYPNLAGDGTRLMARLADTHDALPLDDTAYALLPARRKLKVLLVSDGDLFLEGALLLDENLAVTKVAKYDAAETAKYDAVILDNVTPAEPPKTHALYINPQGASSPFAIQGEVAAPVITESADKHPLLRWVTFKDVNITRASRFVLEPGDVAIASALRVPIIAARDRGRKVAAIGFALQKSDLPMRVAFPVLVVNAVDWFGGNDGDLQASFSTAHPWRLPAPPGVGELLVRDPDKIVHKAPVHEGRATFFGARVGYYEVEPGNHGFAANLASPAESRIEPRTSLVVDGVTLAPPEPGKVGLRRALWAWLALFALVILGVEWWTYNRRVTV
jgi:hypothetical protein